MKTIINLCSFVVRHLLEEKRLQLLLLSFSFRLFFFKRHYNFILVRRELHLRIARLELIWRRHEVKLW